MNEQKSPAVPDENSIEELLGTIQPLPSETFHQKMQQAGWRTGGLGSQVERANHQRARLVLVMAVVLLIAGLLISPQGRAWAQEVFQFFSRINAQTVELPESQAELFKEGLNDSYDMPLVPVFIPTVSPEMAVLTGCDTPPAAQSYACQIALAESKLGFDLKEFQETPEYWRFDSLSYNAASKSAMIQYTVDIRYQSSGTFLLMQGLGDFPKPSYNTPWEVVPADKVETVKVGNDDGEYVKGSFGVPQENNLTWSDSYLHRLAWSDGTKWYLIELWPNPNLPNSISREQLIELAEGLVDSPEQTKSLDPEALHSIADAEELSGFDLKAPALLPLDIDFEYARYYADNQEVQLFYGINNELVIHQWKGKSVDFDSLSTSNSDYEMVKVDGERAFYGSVGGADEHLFLWWEQDGTYYQMYYYNYFGRTIDKEKLLAIAESMENVNDFRTKDSRPYEYVSIYEQALGFDVKEFPETPAAWSYASVWGDIYGRCIGLIYRSRMEAGWMIINQCNTDKYFDVSDIPAGVSQRVQIGNIAGTYAAGEFITRDDGKLLWNPDLPVKRLYWQEGGRWIEMTLSGESARFHEKEDLISYAESLH